MKFHFFAAAAAIATMAFGGQEVSALSVEEAATLRENIAAELTLFKKKDRDARLKRKEAGMKDIDNTADGDLGSLRRSLIHI